MIAGLAAIAIVTGRWSGTGMPTFGATTENA
ncbi:MULTISPECIES: hypothetical protein [Rhizobium/Agrobacterium group]|jgi:hypothetical protein